MSQNTSRHLIRKALLHLGCKWSNVENDTTKDIYDNIVWEDENNKPTRDEVHNKLTELQNDKAFRILRNKRNRLLADSDYLAMQDYPHSTNATKQAWLTYRQELRDLPENTTPVLGEFFEADFLITNVTWPVPPS